MQKTKKNAFSMQKIKKICIANANWEKKTRQINAKNIKKLHCQCKLGKKTRQIDAKNRNLHCQCKDLKNLHCQLKNEKHLCC